MNPHRHPDGPLRVTRVQPGLSPDPCDGPFAVERLTALTHDLSNLLDGSMRCLLLARRSLEAAAPEAHLDTAMRHVETVYGALERMAELVHAAMSGAGALSPAAQHWVRCGVTLRDAVLHAADVLAPEAHQLGVRIEARVSERAGALPAGPLYCVVLNGMRNALESIARAQRQVPRRQPGSSASAAGGLIEVFADAGPMNAAGVVMLRIEIRDDGLGLSSAEEGSRAIEVGYSRKPGSAGVGLALAHETVREVGGSVELIPRDDRGGSARPGALLRINYPIVVGV